MFARKETTLKPLRFKGCYLNPVWDLVAEKEGCIRWRVCPCWSTAPHCSRYPPAHHPAKKQSPGLFFLTPSAPLGFKSLFHSTNEQKNGIHKGYRFFVWRRKFVALSFPHTFPKRSICHKELFNYRISVRRLSSLKIIVPQSILTHL